MKQMESNTISSDNISGVSAIHEAIGVTVSLDDPDSEGEVREQGLEAACVPLLNASGLSFNYVYERSLSWCCSSFIERIGWENMNNEHAAC